MRPLLRPGTHVLQRSDGSLQVGLDPARAVVVDDPGVVSGGLLGGTVAESPQLSLLDSLDLLVDERAAMPLVATESPGLSREVGAALVRDAGADAPARVRARRRCRVAVVGFGHPAAHSLVGTLCELLARAGLVGTRPQSRTSTPLGVLLGAGEPDRELADQWLRDRTPYLVVRMTEGRAVVGPFVVPGRTACLRCVDAHHTDADPDWPLLVRQYAQATARDRADGMPEPVDPALATIALAWAARDIASFADGQRPSTWSSTLALAGDLASLETQGWLRHPECGCSWR